MVLEVNNHPTFVSTYSITSNVGVVWDVVLLFFGAFIQVRLCKCEEEGIALLQSDVRIGIFATRPVSERRLPMFAKMKDDGEWASGKGRLFGTGGDGSGLESFWGLMSPGNSGGLGCGTGMEGLACGEGRPFGDRRGAMSFGASRPGKKKGSWGFVDGGHYWADVHSPCDDGNGREG